jgi:hypothetical protein
MDKLIEVPTEEEMTYIARQWILANRMSEELSSISLDRTIKDLSGLQKILDANILTVEHSNQLSAVGIAFAQVFINEVSDYDWWMVEDEYGRDVAVRYKETSLVIFPESMISNRIEENFSFTIDGLFDDLKNDLDKIIEEHYQDA